MWASVRARGIPWTVELMVAVLMVSLSASVSARAASLALHEPATRNRVAAGPGLETLARRGDPRAEARLGFAYQYGYGVPQNYVIAVMWYRRAAMRGNATAQYLLGLMYDRGQGVDEDTIVAQKWLILAVANATGRQRDNYVRIRDAVASKMTAEEIVRAQSIADAWSRRHRR
jgi:TPR repeat protein